MAYLAIMDWAAEYDPKTDVPSGLVERLRTDFSGSLDELRAATNQSSPKT